MRFGLAALLATSACAQEPNATLASLRDIGEVTFNVDFYAEHPIWVGLGVDTIADLSEYAYPNCLLLDDSFGGLVGGLKTRPSFGGNEEEEETCRAIRLTVIEDGPLLNQTVELHDRSSTIIGTFAATALGPRYAIHPTWEFLPGTNTFFMWSHPPDLASSATVYVSFRSSTGGEPFQFAVPTDEQIPIVVPALPPGDVEVYFQLYDYSPVPALECINAASCTASFFPPETTGMVS
jgi:hypothetical protein